eukprot:sb/3469532/
MTFIICQANALTTVLARSEKRESGQANALTVYNYLLIPPPSPGTNVGAVQSLLDDEDGIERATAVSDDNNLIVEDSLPRSPTITPGPRFGGASRTLTRNGSPATVLPPPRSATLNRPTSGGGGGRSPLSINPERHHAGQQPDMSLYGHHVPEGDYPSATTRFQDDDDLVDFSNRAASSMTGPPPTPVRNNNHSNNNARSREELYENLLPRCRFDKLANLNPTIKLDP